MDAFAWGVIGSVAGVIGTGAAIVFGFIPLWQNRRAARQHTEAETAAVDVRIGQYIENYVQHRQMRGIRPDGLVVVGEIPRVPPAFQSRDDLAAALATGGHGVVLVHALTGMRGVGKTQVAAAYARSRIDGQWRLVVWVSAAELAGVLAGLGEAATRLGLGKPGGSMESNAQSVRHWLEADGDRCLVVFDNVTDLDHLARFLPAVGGSQVILTSNQVTAASFGSAVPVDVFTEEQGLAFLAQRTGLADEHGARNLGGELGWLPLALAQAGAVIAIEHLDYPAYLARLRAHPAHKYLGRPKGEPYPHGTAETIAMALDASAGSDPAGLCGPLMDLAALLSPAGAPRELLRVAGQTGLLIGPDGPETVAAEEIDAALGCLASVSLLTFSLDNSAVIAHRLTMRVAAERLAARGGLPTVGTAAADLLQAVTESLHQPWQNRPAARDTVQQIMALHDSVSRYASEEDAGLTAKLLRLRAWALWCLVELGDSFSQAIEVGQEVVADSERMLGESHPDTLHARNNLAVAYQAVGRVGEAIQLQERALAERVRVLGESHPDTLISRNNLAAAYKAAGRLEEAIPLCEGTLADAERVLGADHPNTRTFRDKLAAAYESAGRSADAEATRNVAPEVS